MHIIARSSSDLYRLMSQVNMDMDHGWLPSPIKTSKVIDNFHYCILRKPKKKYLDTSFNSEIIVSGICQECGVSFKGGKSKKYCCDKCCKLASRRRVKERQEQLKREKQELLCDKYKGV